MPYLIGTAVVMAIIGFAGTKIVENPSAILASVKQVNLLDDGTEVIRVTVPGIGTDVQANQAPFVKIQDLRYDADQLTEMRWFPISSCGLAMQKIQTSWDIIPTALQPSEELVYRAGELTAAPIPRDSDDVYIQNTETDEATIQFTFVRHPKVREASHDSIGSYKLGADPVWLDYLPASRPPDRRSGDVDGQERDGAAVVFGADRRGDCRDPGNDRRAFLYNGRRYQDHEGLQHHPDHGLCPDPVCVVRRLDRLRGDRRPHGTHGAQQTD